MHVLLTVDTEVWPLETSGPWPRERLTAAARLLPDAYEAYLIGDTPSGVYGLPYLLRRFAEHGLKSVFFVESLYSLVMGPATLANTVREIEEAGQEVQLHVHTEWLGDVSAPGLPAEPGGAMWRYSLEEQSAILRAGLQALTACTAEPVAAFRAGSYAANMDTLRALHGIEMRFDSSYNAAYIPKTCRMGELGDINSPMEFGGVRVFPIACFEDRPGHLRHAQVCAASFRELREVLICAREQGWDYFVIVLHSSELINKQDLGNGLRRGRADRTLIKRFDQLCAFLGEHSAEFPTIGFNQLDANESLDDRTRGPLRSSRMNTALRYMEQMRSRYLP